MFLLLTLLLVLCWAGGCFLFHVGGFLVHLLLLVAVLCLIAHFLTGSRS